MIIHFFLIYSVNKNISKVRFSRGSEKTHLPSNSLRSTDRKLFSLYTNANSYKDNTEFDGLVAQAIKHS